MRNSTFTLFLIFIFPFFIFSQYNSDSSHRKQDTYSITVSTSFQKMDLFTGIGTQLQHRKWIYGLTIGFGTRTTFFSSKMYPELDGFVAYDFSRKKQRIYLQPMLCAKYAVMNLNALISDYQLGLGYQLKIPLGSGKIFLFQQSSAGPSIRSFSNISASKNRFLFLNYQLKIGLAYAL